MLLLPFQTFCDYSNGIQFVHSNKNLIIGLKRFLNGAKFVKNGFRKEKKN